MVYKIEDVNHLEVMASLGENQAKEVSAKEMLSSVVASESKEEFTGKILKLCGKLRSQGFDKQANAIEKKFITYKIAKTHLYRAHDEDGEDLVNEAHPDGDVHIADATDNHGDFSTSLSRHKKIVDIINKTPTGKLASYVKSCKIALSQVPQLNIDAAKKYLTIGLTDLNNALALTKGKGLIYRSSVGTADFYDDTEELIQSVNECLEDLKSKNSEVISSKLKDLADNTKRIIEVLNKYKPADASRIELASSFAGIINTFLTKIHAASWGLQGNLAAADFQARQVDTGKVYNQINALLIGLNNVKFLTDSKINDQTRATIAKLQSISASLIKDLKTVSDLLAGKPTIVFDDIKKVLLKSQFLNKINSVEELIEGLNNIKEQINGSLQKLNVEEHI